jgi:hypothetical protein
MIGHELPLSWHRRILAKSWPDELDYGLTASNRSRSLKEAFFANARGDHHVLSS